jgi:proton-coupled amino acid transporter
MNAFSPENVPFFFGIAVFAFEGNGIILSLHSSMKEPEKYSTILKQVIAITITLLIAVSTIAYHVRLESKQVIGLWRRY